MNEFFNNDISPDWQGLLDFIMRKGTPERVHFIELFLDVEIKDAVCNRLNLLENLEPSDLHYNLKKEINIQRCLGYDYVRCNLDDFTMPLEKLLVEDTSGIKREEGRKFIY